MCFAKSRVLSNNCIICEKNQEKRKIKRENEKREKTKEKKENRKRCVKRKR